jgi:hypothetical protein
MRMTFVMAADCREERPFCAVDELSAANQGTTMRRNALVAFGVALAVRRKKADYRPSA